MLGSIFKTAVRNLVRNKIYATINIVGLTIGIACSFLILLHVQNELSYDKFHSNHERIYRLYERHVNPNGYVWTRSITGAAPAPRLKQDFPEIEQAVRFLSLRTLVTANQKKIFEDRVFYVDREVFDVFSFRLLEGDRRSALAAPYSVVLTESAAKKYFGTANAVGKVISFNNSMDMTVTGILEDAPQNSHLKFDFLASLETLITRSPAWNEHWDCPARTFLLLSEGSDPKVLEAKLQAFVERYRDEETSAKLSYGLQVLRDVHLNPASVDPEATEGTTRLIMFAVIAGLILLIAVINFVNLSTAQYTRRVEEVSVRKVLGASQEQLRWQFMGESTVLALAAALLSVPLAELFLPVFNNLVRGSLEVNYLANPLASLGLLAFVAMVGLVGGSYPAFVMARYNPTEVLRRANVFGGRGVFLRRAMVVFQFAVSAALVLSAVVFYSQFDFLSRKDLGFDTGNLVVLPIERNYSETGLTAALKAKLLTDHRVLAVSACSNYPGDENAYRIDVRTSGSIEKSHLIKIYADHDYLKTIGLTLSDGRDFAPERAGDTRQALIVNESAAKYFGEAVSVGAPVRVFDGSRADVDTGYDATVIGKVNDFHFRDLSYRPQPAVILVAPERASYLLVRISSDDPAGTIASIKNTYAGILPDRPFEFFLLTDALERNYQNEQRYSMVFGNACFLAVFVALIGLFGLALLSTHRRVKEIGIRKVFGASTAKIVSMFATEFVILVVLANFVALPIAYYFLNDWLSVYPYRISWNAYYFISVAATTLVLALLTVGYQSFRAASANPVDSLRSE